MHQVTEPLQRSIVAKDILNELRYEIITGKLGDGEYLLEVPLSQRLNVSRGPVRSAIQQLIADGLAAHAENGRTRVVGITSKDIEDIYELRMFLEKKAVECLLEKDVTEFVPLMDVLSRMKDENAKGEACDRRAMAVLGYEIHQTLMGCSGNKAVWNAWKSIASILYLIMEMNSDYVDGNRAYNSHKELVEAILQKRQDIEQVIVNHLVQDSKEIYLNSVQEKRLQSKEIQ